MKVAPSSSVKHFKLNLTNYLEAIVVQAQHRDDHTLFQSVEEYILYRREDVGQRIVFFPFQLPLNLPDEALFHPVIVEMEYLTALMVSIDNVSLRLLLFLVDVKRIRSVRIWYLTTRSKPSMTSTGIS